MLPPHPPQIETGDVGQHSQLRNSLKAARGGLVCAKGEGKKLELQESQRACVWLTLNSNKTADGCFVMISV